MARIIYAASGEGLGHATRAHSVGAGLLARGHDVRFIASLKASDYLGQHYPDRLLDIYGFKLHIFDGRVHYARTALDIFARSLSALPSTYAAVGRLLLEFNPHLIISDAEWFSSSLAWFLRLPLVSLDNQHLLTHCRVQLPPSQRREYWLAYLFIRLFFSFGARRNLVTTFIRAPIRYQPTTLLPPVIRQRVRDIQPGRGDYLVAYLGAQGGNVHLRRQLEAFTEMPIRAYGFGVSGQCGMVEYKPTSEDGFLRDLAGCAGVIASAGHSLISECIHLEKPMLLVPFAGQFEQRLNAFHVQRMGLGKDTSVLTTDVIRGFTDQLDRFTTALRAEPKCDLKPVLDAIEREL
jgi:uncharacterized protein (TIGR00661 family)